MFEEKKKKMHFCRRNSPGCNSMRFWSSNFTQKANYIGHFLLILLITQTGFEPTTTQLNTSRSWPIVIVAYLMELFIRRRWRLVLAQVVSCYVLLRILYLPYDVRCLPYDLCPLVSKQNKLTLYSVAIGLNGL